MAQQAALDFDYRARADARTVQRSLSPEVGDIDGDRTRATLSRDGSTLTISIEADDLIALRAGLNTWCSLVSVAEQCAGVETP